MKVKIVSDGTISGTKVINEETGEEVEQVVSVHTILNAHGEAPKAIITVACPAIEIIAEAETRKMAVPEPIKVPNTLEECFEVLKQKLHPDDFKQFKEADEKEALAMAHHGLGRTIRNDWGLWTSVQDTGEVNELASYFLKLGLTHPDDMSGMILTSFHRHLNEKELDVEGQVEYYKEYWARVQVEKEVMGSEEVVDTPQTDATPTDRDSDNGSGAVPGETDNG